jgi:adenylate cyclase 10
LTNFWLIIIDDIEFADEESIVLLESLITLNTYHLFFVLSKGHQRKLSNNAREVLAHQQITTIRLTPIDIVHVKALICQFLDVVAIPLELERIVCRKGNGNPGWIQNFLVLLTQAQKLKVEQVEIDYAVSIGLIFVELRYRPVDYLDFWDLYATSFSQHAQQTSQEQEGGSPNMIKVAIMSSDGQISTFEKDLQADCESITTSLSWYKNIFLFLLATNLILYDSLSPYEQLICKCASVFGHQFLRVMLLHLLTTSTDYMVAKAIQKLFELHIFGCAHGDFQSLNIVYQRNENTQMDEPLRCYCNSLPVPGKVILDSKRDRNQLIEVFFRFLQKYAAVLGLWIHEIHVENLPGHHLQLAYGNPEERISFESVEPFGEAVEKVSADLQIRRLLSLICIFQMR